MRTVPTALQTHIDGTVTSLARLCTITRQDGEIIRFTDAQTDIAISANTYLAATGVRLSAIQSRSDGTASNCTLSIASENGGLIDFDEVLAGRFDAAEMRVSLVNQAAPADEAMILFTGQAGTTGLTDRGACQIEFKGPASRARSQIAPRFQQTCRADLGDAKCLFDLSTVTVAGTVSALISEFVIEADDITDMRAVDDWFKWGCIVWTSGANVGTMVEVRGWVQSTTQLTIMLPTAGVVEVGDTFDVFAGCDKRASTCRTKFNNLVHFRGEPHVPGPVTG